MAATTESYNLTTSWQKISNGQENVAIQISSSSTVMVFAGETAPTEIDSGFVLSTNTDDSPKAIAFSNLALTDAIYARSVSASARVVVIAY